MTRFANVSFISIVLILFIHAYNVTLVIDNQIVGGVDSLAWWLQSFIGDGISRVGVPLFFLISGNRFAYGLEVNIVPVLVGKIKKRFVSLLLPFFLWSLLGMLLVFVLQLIPFSAPYFNSAPLINLTAKQLADMLFLYPFSYQLWFLQVLWLLVLISPVIILAIKYLPEYLVVAFLLVIWYLYGGYEGFSQYFFEGFAFFALGIFLGIKERLPEDFKFSIGWIFVWLLLIGLKLYFIKEGWFEYAKLVGKGSVIIGILVVYAYASQIVTFFKVPQSAVKQTFFIYLAHEPMLTIVKKGLLSGISPLNGCLITVYFVSVAIVLFITIGIGLMVERFSPRIYSFLIGGR